MFFICNTENILELCGFVWANAFEQKYLPIFVFCTEPLSSVFFRAKKDEGFCIFALSPKMLSAIVISTIFMTQKRTDLLSFIPRTVILMLLKPCAFSVIFRPKLPKAISLGIVKLAVKQTKAFEKCCQEQFSKACRCF